MSAIVGILRRDGGQVSAETVSAMSAALIHRGAHADAPVIDGPAGLARRTPGEASSLWCARSSVLQRGREVALVADARIDNGAELVAALGLPASERENDAALIIGAYERWGVDCARHLLGDFAFAIWDSRAQRLVCARDHMGVRPFYYHGSRSLLAFASEIKALFRVPEIPRDVCDHELALHLAALPPDRESTMWRGVRRLPAASVMIVDRDRISISRYWSPDARSELRVADRREYVEGFREIFDQAVRARLRGEGRIGATLSGGLDSSSIVCTARAMPEALSGGTLHTFSLVFDDLPPDELRVIDERPFIEAVIAGGGVTAHRIRGDHLSPLGEIDRVHWLLDEPHGAANLYLHWAMYAAAHAAGVHVLLDGFDGDTAVGHGFGRFDELACAGDWDTFESEVRRYAAHRGMPPERVLEHFGLPLLGELARRGRCIAWLRSASQLSRRFGLSRRDIVSRFGLGALAPRRRQESWRRPRPGTVGPSEFVRDTVVRRAAEHRRFVPLSAPSPLAGERSAHAHGIAQPLYQAALEIADKAARSFGIEPRFPFFDRRLIEFCLALPPDEKLSDGWSRYVLRRAMGGRLPSIVQWRSGKSNLSPNFHRRLHSVDRERLLAASAPHSPIDRYADLAALERMTHRFLAGNGRTRADGTGEALVRAAGLAAWLRGSGRESEMRTVASDDLPARPNTAATGFRSRASNTSMTREESECGFHRSPPARERVGPHGRAVANHPHVEETA